MFNLTHPMKRILLKSLPILGALLLFAPQAQAAKYVLSDNDSLVKGCSGTIEIKIDTEGANVMAGDSTLNISAGAVSVDQISIGSALPMQVFSQSTESQIKLSGARLPLSGAFKGVGTFGYITFTPDIKASQGFFNFSSDLTADNTLVNENIDNVLTEAVSKTYTFRDRYNVGVDGVGFCSPDTAGPAVEFVTPLPTSVNNPVDSHIIFILSDDRAGVDINTLDFSVDGVSYNSQSPQMTVNPDGKRYRVEMTPPQPFTEGASVAVKAKACDRNAPSNCTDATATFRIFVPTPPPSICGDRFLNPQNGEQCDDGNRITGDGCSFYCLLETAPLSAATCFDGLQNQAESGVDCGGPCSLACSTCVDGKINQGETGVDCGGPCPSCGDQEKVVCEAPTGQTSLETVTICHTPANDLENPYTMVVPKSLWPDYEKAGDVLGPCSTELLCDILIPVAPEIEKKAAEEAKVVVDTEESVIEQVTTIEAPTIDQIDICRAIPDYLKADFNNPSADTDGDGLSDRTECYAKTSPINPDTDGDGCTDGDELNRFNSSAIDSNDCTIATETEQGFNQVLITDPKPSWTLGNLSPRFSGMVPPSSIAVTITAFHADQKAVKDLSAAANAVLQANSLDSATKAIENLKASTANARKFVDLNGADFNYADLQAVVSKIEAQTETLEKDILGSGSFVPKDYFETLKALGFGDLGLELGGLLRESIIIGSSNDFSETLLGDQSVGSFELLPGAPLEDQKLYDVVATATLIDTTISSGPIQFGVNTGFTVTKPIPRTLGGILIPSGQLSFGGILIDNAFAQNEAGAPQIEIDQLRPVITGDTEFGSQVFAIWNSVVLSSSVISDSEQGAFEIQAPKDLETDTTHRVTLYAVKTDKSKTLRSESVDIYFRIKSQGTAALPVAAATGGAITLIGGGYFLVRRMQNARSVIKLLRSTRK